MQNVTNKPGVKKKELKRAIRHEILAIDYLNKALALTNDPSMTDYIKKAIRELPVN